ncbi:MAG: hypothetical protein N0E38_18815, partial [Candidatus Thiodiazotropha endolucinida]|nr:hypothetical protein [Candidatus Thiodiazotropha taylori]MCW4350984.1 hypothetical protein [Candidatus Thiodiazotropha endolucinida]
ERSRPLEGISSSHRFPSQQSALRIHQRSGDKHNASQPISGIGVSLKLLNQTKKIPRYIRENGIASLVIYLMTTTLLTGLSWLLIPFK